jgi:hypothetical protein
MNLEQIIDLQLSNFDGWDKVKIKLNKVAYSDEFSYGFGQVMKKKEVLDPK